MSCTLTSDPAGVHPTLKPHPQYHTHLYCRHVVDEDVGGYLELREEVALLEENVGRGDQRVAARGCVQVEGIQVPRIQFMARVLQIGFNPIRLYQI